MNLFDPLDLTRQNFPVVSDLVVLMSRHLQYIERFWTNDDDRLGHFGSLDVADFAPEGGPINEMVIRSMTQELQGYAVLYKSPDYDASATGYSREHLLDRINRCSRWVCAHHLTGDRRSAPLEWDGQWGDDWESSLWAGQLAMAAHHVWDDLEADVRADVLQLLAFEGDRFLGVDPPDGRWRDTKAEENAWDSFLLAWAYCLQPDHPNAAGWLDRGKAFALNTFTTDRDRVDTRPLEGRALCDLVCTQTAHPDLTVENHGSFHPGYLGCGGLLLEGGLAFRETGLPVPPHYTHNVREAWLVLRRFLLANGFTSYPSGQDWSYHHPGVSVQHAIMARDYDDEIAAHLLWESVRYVDEATRFAGDGRFDARMPVAAGGRYFQFETGVMGHLGATAMAGLPAVGRMDPNRFRALQQGCESYPYVWMQVRRSRAGLFAFSWRSLRQLPMGTVIPANGESTFGSAQDAMVGRFVLDGETLVPRVLCHTDHTGDKGFRTTGLVEYAEGGIRQGLSVVALDDGETVVIVDVTRADPGIEPETNEALGIYVMNDFMNENRVSCVHANGRMRVRGVGGKARTVDTGSTWLRVQGCLGVETEGATLFYEDAAERNAPARWKSVLQDRIFTRPAQANGLLRDTCTVLRMGRAGARRVGAGVTRIQTADPDVRAYRIVGRSSEVTLVVNFADEPRTVAEMGDVVIPAVDTHILA